VRWETLDESKETVLRREYGAEAGKPVRNPPGGQLHDRGLYEARSGSAAEDEGRAPIHHVELINLSRPRVADRELRESAASLVPYLKVEAVPAIGGRFSFGETDTPSGRFGFDWPLATKE
jgi:hypothetical protein